ncbi:hypothetical protein G3A43_06635 [Paraburkholderia aspalathi]|nr:hypothetical protein [Paraburkholderia aspalathi]MBK3779926.1 hypothetical protein [Paraburkholderia aspalathi]
MALGPALFLFVFFGRGLGEYIGNAIRADSGATGAVLAVLVLLVFCLQNPPAAVDDALRDIASSAYEFDYHRLYADANLQQYNAYIGFDRGVAVLSHLVGPVATLHLVQASVMAAFMVLLVLLAKKTCTTLTAEHYALIALTLATPLSGRVFLARPEIVLTAWGCYAALVSRRWQLVLWAVVGAALVPCYWLAALYFPFALLLQTRLRNKVLVVAGLGAWQLVFWHLQSDGTYFESLHLLSVWPANRAGPVLETESILRLFLNLQFVVLALLAGMALSTKVKEGRMGWREVNIGLLFAYYLMSGMVRYSAAWAMLLYMLAVPWVGAQPVRNVWLRAGLLLFPMYCAAAIYNNVSPMSALPAFQYPAGAYVLTGMDASTYATPFYNAGKVRVAPSMELGANTKPVQLLAVGMNKGQLDCKELLAQPEHFTHVVESRLSVVPSCLRLMAVQGGWRQWEVVRDSAAAGAGER